MSSVQDTALCFVLIVRTYVFRVVSVDLDALVNSALVSLPDGTIFERDPLKNTILSDGSIFCNFKGDDYMSADFVVFDGRDGEVSLLH